MDHIDTAINSYGWKHQKKREITMQEKINEIEIFMKYVIYLREPKA